MGGFTHDGTEVGGHFLLCSLADRWKMAILYMQSHGYGALINIIIIIILQALHHFCLHINTYVSDCSAIGP